jgi:oxygen-independent coproporphyrinogen-3 oxidase
LQQDSLPIRHGLVLNDEDHLRAAIIQQLSCYLELEFAGIEQQFDIDFRDHFAHVFPVLEDYARDGLLAIHGDRVEISDKGVVFIRNICAAFDEYLPDICSSERPKFSRSV